MKSQRTVPPLTHTVSVEVGPPVIDVYERCLLGVFQATVCACRVERVCSRAVYLSYLSIFGPWWRGTRVLTSTVASGTRRIMITSTCITGDTRVRKGLRPMELLFSVK